MRIPRKLKKKYKKMGIWEAYLSVERYSNSPEFVEFRRRDFHDLVTYGILWVPQSDEPTKQ